MSLFFQERTKALGYITSNDLDKLDHPNSKSLKDSGINELIVNLVQCLKLKSSRKGIIIPLTQYYQIFSFIDEQILMSSLSIIYI